MSMDHSYNNHGSMGQYCGSCKWGIRKAIAREYKHQNALKLTIFECLRHHLYHIILYYMMVPGND